MSSSFRSNIKMDCFIVASGLGHISNFASWEKFLFDGSSVHCF